VGNIRFFDQSHREQIVDQKTACNLAGVPYSTYNEWKARGDKDEEPFASFFSVISRARDKHELRLLKIINDAAEGTLPRHADWKAAAWQLERGWPKKYAPFDRRPIPVEDDFGKPKQFDVAIICKTEKPLDELLNFPVAPVAEPAAPKPAISRRPIVGFGGKVIGWTDDEPDADDSAEQ
jgi:hypothetical protein